MNETPIHNDPSRKIGPYGLTENQSAEILYKQKMKENLHTAVPNMLSNLPPEWSAYRDFRIEPWTCASLYYLIQEQPFYDSLTGQKLSHERVQSYSPENFELVKKHVLPAMKVCIIHDPIKFQRENSERGVLSPNNEPQKPK